MHESHPFNGIESSDTSKGWKNNLFSLSPNFRVIDRLFVAVTLPSSPSLPFHSPSLAEAERFMWEMLKVERYESR